jgi:hypothetical protein
MPMTQVDNRLILYKDAMSVLSKCREVYAVCKQIQVLQARFATDQAFSDAFDYIMYIESPEFDGTVAPSQMIQSVGTLVTAWEASAIIRDALLLPPL